MKTTTLFVLILLMTFVTSCKKEDDNVNDNSEQAASILNENFSIQRTGTFTIDPANATVDNSVSVFPTGGFERVPLRPGESMKNQIAFQSPNNNITAIGMRYGNSGSITFAT